MITLKNADAVKSLPQKRHCCRSLSRISRHSSVSWLRGSANWSKSVPGTQHLKLSQHCYWRFKSSGRVTMCCLTAWPFKLTVLWPLESSKITCPTKHHHILEGSDPLQWVLSPLEV